MEFRTLRGEPRKPTWAEREHLEELRGAGVEDVYTDPDDALPPFWEAILIAVDHHLLLLNPSESARRVWKRWAEETRYAQGWPPFVRSPWIEFQDIIRNRQFVVGTTQVRRVTTGERLASIEHLLDAVEPDDTDFDDAVNERARFFRVGLNLHERRFVPLTSELMHVEVVQPTLLLLAAPELRAVDDLYRKGFERALGNDPAGAITAATSAVEEMLRLKLGVTGSQLKPLAEKARTQGLIIPAVLRFCVSLASLREDSDAHTAGTNDFNVAMLAIHLTGSILLHLGRAEPV